MPRTFLLINRCVVVLEWMSATRNANFALIGNHRSDTDTHSHNKHLWEWLGVSSIGMRLKSWVQNLTNKWRKKDDEYIKQLLIFNPCACSINNTVSFTVLSRFRNIPLREWVSLYAFLSSVYLFGFWTTIHTHTNVNKNMNENFEDKACVFIPYVTWTKTNSTQPIRIRIASAICTESERIFAAYLQNSNIKFIQLNIQ